MPPVMPGRDYSCAVVVKCFSWDPFVERQLVRMQEVASGFDVYLSVDNTSGAVNPPRQDNILMTNQAEMIALGLADRYEKGSLLWWNADYTHYQVFKKIPDYDYYLFIEYDAWILGGVRKLMDRVVGSGAETVTLVRRDMKNWFWTKFYHDLYPGESCRGSLNCITIHSRNALAFLFEKRKEMSRRKDIPFWPLSEVVILSELVPAGFRCGCLSEFGDISRYEWFPPVLEDDLDFSSEAETAFIHPVLDRRRYIKSLLLHTHFVKDYFLPDSSLRRELGRFPGAVRPSEIGRAALVRGVARVVERVRGY